MAIMIVVGFWIGVTGSASLAQTKGGQCHAFAAEAVDLGGLPAYDTVNLLDDDDLFPDLPDNVVIYPPPRPPRYVPDGPPRPSAQATGRLPIVRIHAELNRIYNDCTQDSNAAFDGVAPDPGDTTHDHLDCGDCELKPRRNWRCGGYRMGINKAYEDILRAKCDSVIMAAEKNCVLHEHERIDEEGFFRCENEKEWFVQLPNYFFYNLEFNSLLNISRNLSDRGNPCLLRP